MSEEDSASSVEVINERKFIIKTDKENEMELFLRNYSNDEFGISIFSTKTFPKKKYELKCKLEQIQLNRFFKIFRNTDEIIQELETKIDKAIFLEDDNNIRVEINIGLTVINQIELEIKQTEKSKEEIIQEFTNLIEEIETLKNNNIQLNNNINLLTINNNNLNDQINQKNNKIMELENEIKTLKSNHEQIKNNQIIENNQKIENLQKQITQLKKDYNDLNNSKTIKENELNTIIDGLNNQLNQLNKLKEEILPEPKGKYILCIIIF